MKLSFREKLFALRMKLRYNEDFQKEYLPCVAQTFGKGAVEHAYCQ